MTLLLADNDVLIKAAHWKLLDYLPECTGIGWDETSVLESLRHRARNKDAKLFRDPMVAKVLSGYLDRTAPLPLPAPSVVARLEGIEGIEAGESILIASACAHGKATLVTGDKRALRTLAQPLLAEIHIQLQGRVVCLEHLLWCALDHVGADQLAEAVASFPGLDTVAECVIPPPGRAKEAEIRFGLKSYLQALECETRGLIRV